MNRQGTIWLQGLQSHHLHQSQGQHPIPRVVEKIGDCDVETFKKAILSTQVFFQCETQPTNQYQPQPPKQKTNQQKKKTKLSRNSSIHISIFHDFLTFPASSPRRNVPAPHRRLPPSRGRPAGLPGPWPAPRGVPQH